MSVSGVSVPRNDSIEVAETPKHHHHDHHEHDSNCTHAELHGQGVRRAANNLKNLVDKSKRQRSNNSSPSDPEKVKKKSSLSVPMRDSFKQSSIDSAASCDSNNDCYRQKTEKPQNTLQLNWSPQKASSETHLGVDSPFAKAAGINSTSESNQSKLKPSLSEDFWPDSTSNLQNTHNGSISNSINVSDPKLCLGSKSRINSKRPIISSIDKFLHARKRSKGKGSRKASISSFTTDHNPRKSLPDTNHLLQLMEPSVSQKRQMFKSFRGGTGGPTVLNGSQEAGSYVANDADENGDISENEELLTKPFESPRLLSIQRNKPANVNVVQSRPPLPALKPFENSSRHSGYSNHI